MKLSQTKNKIKNINKSQDIGNILRNKITSNDIINNFVPLRKKDNKLSSHENHHLLFNIKRRNQQYANQVLKVPALTSRAFYP